MLYQQGCIEDKSATLITMSREEKRAISDNIKQVEAEIQSSNPNSGNPQGRQIGSMTCYIHIYIYVVLLYRVYSWVMYSLNSNNAVLNGLCLFLISICRVEISSIAILYPINSLLRPASFLGEWGQMGVGRSHSPVTYLDRAGEARRGSAGAG